MKISAAASWTIQNIEERSPFDALYGPPDDFSQGAVTWINEQLIAYITRRWIMLRNLSRIFVILIIAGILAGGTYAFSKTTLAQSTAPTSFEGRPEPVADAPDTPLNSDSDQATADRTGDFEHRPPEDMSIWARFSGILTHTVIIAFIIVVVTYVQKLIKWISAKPKTRLSHQKI